MSIQNECWRKSGWGRIGVVGEGCVMLWQGFESYGMECQGYLGRDFGGLLVYVVSGRIKDDGLELGCDGCVWYLYL